MLLTWKSGAKLQIRKNITKFIWHFLRSPSKGLRGLCRQFIKFYERFYRYFDTQTNKLEVHTPEWLGFSIIKWFFKYGLASPIPRDPVGIQTQDLQNRNLSANSLEIPCVYRLLRLSSETHLRRFCADSALLILSISVAKVRKRNHTMPSWNVKI